MSAVNINHAKHLLGIVRLLFSGHVDQLSAVLCLCPMFLPFYLFTYLLLLSQSSRGFHLISTHIIVLHLTIYSTTI